MNVCGTVRAERPDDQMETDLAERLTSALFRVDRAQTEWDLGTANAALSQVLQETDRVGVSLAEVSRMSGLTLIELRQLLD